MTRNFLLAAVAALFLCVPGCVPGQRGEQLQSDFQAFVDSTNDVLDAIDDDIDALLDAASDDAAAAADNPAVLDTGVADEILDAITSVDARFDAVRDDVDAVAARLGTELDTYADELATAEDGVDTALVVGQIVAGLFGFGGIAGAIRTSVNRRRRDTEIVRELSRGQTSADEATLANLPADIAEAIRRAP